MDTRFHNLRSKPPRPPQPSIYAGEPKPRIPELTRINIWVDHKCGMSINAIARKYGVSTFGVRHTIKRRQHHLFFKDVPHKRYPHKINPQLMTRLVSRIRNRDLTTFEQCLTWLHDAHNITISLPTIKKIVKDHDLRAYIKQAKPFVSQQHQEARYAFAREKAGLTDADWARVVFSDEKTFTQSAHGRKERVLLPKGTPLDERRMFPTFCGGGVNVKLWAAIWREGFLAYELYDDALKGTHYIDILERKLVPAGAEKFGEEEWEFQQDNAPCHSIDGVQRLLEDHDINDFHHPPNSPDLNPIENVWAMMIPRVRAKGARTKAELEKAVREVISEMNEEEPQTHFFSHLYGGMHKRMTEVLKNKGLPTNH